MEISLPDRAHFEFYDPNEHRSVSLDFACAVQLAIRNPKAKIAVVLHEGYGYEKCIDCGEMIE